MLRLPSVSDPILGLFFVRSRQEVVVRSVRLSLLSSSPSSCLSLSPLLFCLPAPFSLSATHALAVIHIRTLSAAVFQLMLATRLLRLPLGFCRVAGVVRHVFLILQSDLDLRSFNLDRSLSLFLSLFLSLSPIDSIYIPPSLSLSLSH